MSRLFAIMLLGFLLPHSAPAGLIVEQDMQTNGSTRRVTIRVQDGLVCLDFGNGSSAIIDPAKKTVVTLFHHDAFAVEEHGEEALRKAARLVDTGFAEPRGAPELRTEKLAGHACRVSDWHRGKTAIWLAADYPKYERIQEFLPALRAFNCCCLPALSNTGMTLKTIASTPDGPLTTTLVSARLEKIPAEVFAIAPIYRRQGGEK